MEVVGNRETHAGNSAAVKIIMASQITGPHLSSRNSSSNHTALRLQQPTPSSSHVSGEEGEVRWWFWNGENGEERGWFCNGEEREEHVAAI